jgi:hypothetical protein
MCDVGGQRSERKKWMHWYVMLVFSRKFKTKTNAKNQLSRCYGMHFLRRLVRVQSDVVRRRQNESHARIVEAFQGTSLHNVVCSLVDASAPFPLGNLQ